jgi:hypothetical protein
MSNTVYTPGLGNLPFGNRNLNPQGSNYRPDSAGQNAVETNLIQKEIKRVIFDAAPAQYDALKLIFDKSPVEKNLDEFEYLESTFGRSPLTAGANANAVVAVPNAVVSQTVTLTAGSLSRVSKDVIVIYEDGTHGVISNIAGANVTISSLPGQALPAVTNGQIFAIQSTIESDGMDYISHYDRLDTITRYNYIQLFIRAKRWTRLEMQKFINSGTTDYMTRDKQEKLKQIRIDLFNSFFNGVRGEYTFSNGYRGKAMGGIYPTMLQAGSAFGNPTAAGFKASFEALAFQTNYKAEGSTRFVYGTHEMLNLFSETYKQPGLRYTPNDTNIKLDLKRLEIGGSNYVLVPCELFKERSCFEADWARRILVLDQETISPVKMKGIPMIEMFQTDDRSKGSLKDYTDFAVRANLSLEFNNPIGSFYMNIQ